MNKKGVLFYACTFSIIFLFTIACAPEKSNDSLTNITIEMSPILPKEPIYNDDYVITNIPRERWSKEEVEQWFIIPEGENLERLNAANEQLIKEVLEAAP